MDDPSVLEIPAETPHHLPHPRSQPQTRQQTPPTAPEKQPPDRESQRADVDPSTRARLRRGHHKKHGEIEEEGLEESQQIEALAEETHHGTGRREGPGNEEPRLHGQEELHGHKQPKESPRSVVGKQGLRRLEKVLIVENHAMSHVGCKSNILYYFKRK